MIIEAWTIIPLLSAETSQGMQHGNRRIRKRPLGNEYGRHSCGLACGSVDRSMTFGSRPKGLDPLVADNLQLEPRPAGPSSHVKWSTACLPRIDADFIEHSIEVFLGLGGFFSATFIAENRLQMPRP
jgi:hypothetical protein